MSMNRSVAVLFALFALLSCRSATTPTTTARPAAQVSLSWAPASGDWATDGTRSWAFAPATSLTQVRDLALSFTPPRSGSVTYLLTNTNTVASDVSTVYAPVAANGVKPVNLAVPALPSASAARSVAASAAAPTVYSVGAHFALYDPLTKATRATTLQYQTVNGAETVNYWVEDDTARKTYWNTTNTYVRGQVNLSMLQALAAKFLAASGTADLYHWETGLLGTEWDDSDTATAALIANGTYVATGHQIDIFLVDLNPGVDMDAGEAMYYGYFWAGNLMPHEPGSNQRQLFAVHAPALGWGGTTGSWALSDSAPLQVVSTLAHEFQHMIRFYQKQVRHGLSGDDETWTNEMASMLMEDLLSKRLGTVGPRGVAGATLTAGGANNQAGRFPGFLANRPGVALTGWNYTSADASLAHYSTSYAFGAWLVRNWGGPALVASMVQSADLDATMVAAAVNSVNSLAGDQAQSFASLVRQWGLAQYLGSSTLVPYAYAASGGDFLTDATYSLGSINLANYRWASVPLAWPVLSTASSPSVGAGQTVFFSAGTSDGSTPWDQTVYLPADVALTVVVGP